jgi:hypothetical protein
MTYLVEILEYGSGDVLQKVETNDAELASQVVAVVDAILRKVGCDTHYALMSEA